MDILQNNLKINNFREKNCFFSGIPLALNASSPIKKSKSSPDCPIRLPPGRSRTAIARKIYKNKSSTKQSYVPDGMIKCGSLLPA